MIDFNDDEIELAAGDLEELFREPHAPAPDDGPDMIVAKAMARRSRFAAIDLLVERALESAKPTAG